MARAISLIAKNGPAFWGAMWPSENLARLPAESQTAEGPALVPCLRH